MKNLALKDLMQNHLHGKKARIKSGVCDISDRMEGEVWLEFNEHDGLNCITDLQWNTHKINTALKEGFRPLFGYGEYEKIFDVVDNVINNFKVRIGHISYYGAKNFKVSIENCSYNKDVEYIRSVYITHLNGSITEIILNRP